MAPSQAAGRGPLGWGPRGRSVGWLLGVVALGALLLVGLRGRLRSHTRAPSEDALLEGDRSPSRRAPPSPSPPRARPDRGGKLVPSADGADALPEHGLDPRTTAERRLERARRTLDGYLQSTRYPPGSRPLSEHPDMQRPHSVPPSTQPLARADRKLTDAKVTLEQDRYFVVGDEAARLTASCTTSEGPTACEVVRAEALVAPTMPQAGMIAPAPIAFHDDGQGGDIVAGDGAPTALFAPAREGFGAYHGPIGIELVLHVSGEQGGARFDLLYTPAAPARFTGAVREALQDGSLCLFVEMVVDKPGRYVLYARADDADKRAFAFLEFNEELGAGIGEARVCLFGKLVRDEHALSPFTLRDVEGFLLKENTYPDRETVPALIGPVYTTKAYDESQFSGQEWQSADKKRHIDEFTKDVAEAEVSLRELESGGGL